MENLSQYREKVLEDARLQLLAATGDAVETLIRLRDDEDAPSAVRLKAAAEILDRAGVVKGAEVTVTTAVVPGMSPAEVIRARLERLAAASASPVDACRMIESAVAPTASRTVPVSPSRSPTNATVANSGNGG